jgi:hypothetical protein
MEHSFNPYVLTITVYGIPDTHRTLNMGYQSVKEHGGKNAFLIAPLFYLLVLT